MDKCNLEVVFKLQLKILILNWYKNTTSEKRALSLTKSSLRNYFVKDSLFSSEDFLADPFKKITYFFLFPINVNCISSDPSSLTEFNNNFVGALC